MYKWCHESRRYSTFVNLQATKISKRCVFILVTWPWRLPEEWTKACGSLTVVGAGTMHGFGTDPMRNPKIWLVESRNRVNLFAYRGRMWFHLGCTGYSQGTRGININSLTPRLYGSSFKSIIFKLLIQNSGVGTRCEIALTRTSLMRINIGSGKGLVLSGNKPLPKLLLAQICVAIWRQANAVQHDVHTKYICPKEHAQRIPTM